MDQLTTASCELCTGDGGATIFRSEKWRVVRVQGAEAAAYPGFCRVIWNEHIRELTDLSAADRHLFMDVVFRVEAALRASLSPHKMNVASLGNLTPHLHWHIIPRFTGDPAFPKPIWAITHATLTADSSLATLANSRNTSESGAWVEAVRRALESA